MLLNCGVGEDSWESLGLQGDPTCPFRRRSVLGVHWKDWCWSWNSITLATWCKDQTHLKRPWCWERLRAGGEGDDIGWDGWMASPTQWTWIWVDSGSWWWIGRPGVLRFMRSQRVGYDWATEMNWAFLYCQGLFHWGVKVSGWWRNFLLRLAGDGVGPNNWRRKWSVGPENRGALKPYSWKHCWGSMSTRPQERNDCIFGLGRGDHLQPQKVFRSP